MVDVSLLTKDLVSLKEFLAKLLGRMKRGEFEFEPMTRRNAIDLFIQRTRVNGSFPNQGRSTKIRNEDKAHLKSCAIVSQGIKCI